MKRPWQKEQSNREKRLEEARAMVRGRFTAPPAARPAGKRYHFDVVGVTYKGRQEYLEWMDAHPLEWEISFNKTQYKGAPAIEVLYTRDGDEEGEVIGFVPADEVEAVLPLLDKTTGGEAKVYGGGYGKSYGCSCTLEYEP